MVNFAATPSRRELVLAYPLPALIDKLSQAGFTVIAWPANEQDCRKLLARAPDVKAVVTIGSKPLPSGFLEAASQLGIIACMGAGYENYDPIELSIRGIRLVNAGDANADDVADLAMALILSSHRRIIEADAGVRAGRWKATIGRRLKGCRLGILGLGSIGKALAIRAQAFGMDIRWWGPNPKQEPWERSTSEFALAEWADTLAVCCRPTPKNEKLVGQRMLDALGPGGVLINVARGSLVDEAALVTALIEGRIAAAGLDVFETEPTDPARWRNVPNVTFHPHCGGGTHEALADGIDRVVDAICRHFAGDPLVNALN